MKVSILIVKCINYLPLALLLPPLPFLPSAIISLLFRYFSLGNFPWSVDSVFHVPVSSTASLASFSVANAPSRPASVSCQTSSSTGTTFSVSNLPGIFPTQVCVSQSSGLSCPHSTQSASIPVPQQQCYYIPTPRFMPVTSSPQSAPQFAPVQSSYLVTATAPVPSEPTTQIITIFQELLAVKENFTENQRLQPLFPVLLLLPFLWLLQLPLQFPLTIHMQRPSSRLSR